MELTNNFTVSASVDRTWEMLTDIEGIAPCMPGAQLTEIDGEEFRGLVKVKVGGKERWVPRAEARALERKKAERERRKALQKHVRHVVEKNLPGRQIDFRPEPERVCPRQGCKSMSVGTLLSRHKQGCLVLALISRPGQSPVTIIPWAGNVKLKTP